MTAKAIEHAAMHTADFRRKHGLPMRSTPGVPPDSALRPFLIKFLEEVAELFGKTVDEHQEFGEEAATIAHEFDKIREMLETVKTRVDVVGATHEAADCMFVLLQYGQLMGVPFGDAVAAVCDANDTKPVARLVNGTVQKGDGYQAPDIRGVLFGDGCAA